MKAKAAVIFAIAALWSGVAVAKDGFQISQTILEVDVAINSFTGQGDINNEFVVQGFVYPSGTLNGENGINTEDGSPEFPDQLIGRFVCRGWAVFPRITPEGIALTASTTQSYEMDLSSPGGDMIVTAGFEGFPPGATLIRAILGGTGQYTNIRGEQRQLVLGINTTQSPNVRVSFVRDVVIAFKRGEEN